MTCLRWSRYWMEGAKDNIKDAYLISFFLFFDEGWLFFEVNRGTANLLEWSICVWVCNDRAHFVSHCYREPQALIYRTSPGPASSTLLHSQALASREFWAHHWRSFSVINVVYCRNTNTKTAKARCCEDNGCRTNVCILVLGVRKAVSGRSFETCFRCYKWTLSALNEGQAQHCTQVYLGTWFEHAVSILVSLTLLVTTARWRRSWWWWWWWFSSTE